MSMTDRVKSTTKKLAREHTIINGYPHKVAATIFYRGNILSHGVNEPYRTHPKANTPYRTRHAEFNAVLYACRMGWELEGRSIYVHRIRRDGKDGIAKPCKWCAKMLEQVGITDIHWSV